MYINRKIFTILFFVSFIYHHIFTSQYHDNFLQIAVTSGALAIGTCTASLILEHYEKSYLPKCASGFKKWAQNQLFWNTCVPTKDKAQSIDFRADTFWRTHTFGISVNKDDQNKIEAILTRKNRSHAISVEEDLNEQANIKYRIFHEYKHYKSYDLLKHHVLCSIPASVMIQTHFLSRFLLSGLATCLTSIAYSRYQETKADQYAFRRMNKEDIEKVQVYMENEAKKDENLILEKMKLHKIRGFFINVIYDISLRFSGNMSEKQKKECITK